MAVLVTENFEGGPLGAALTQLNTDAGNVVGGPTFADGAIEGSLCARYNATGAQIATRFDHAETSLGWVSFYLYAETLPATPTYFMTWSSPTGDKIIDVRLEPDGSVVLRDNFLAVVTSSAIVTAGAWHRVAIRITRNATMELRLYVGSNRHGAVPDWSGTGNTSRDFPLGRLLCGVTTANTLALRVDRLRIDNASEPASMIPQAPPLPTPTITVTKTDPTTSDGTDGTITVTAGPSAGAAKIEVGVIPGRVTTGEPATFMTIPGASGGSRTFTGFAAGIYTGTAIAK